MAKKKKIEKVDKSDIPKVELVERIPTENVDLEAFERFLHSQLQAIHADRKMWESRRAEYFQDIDNFVNYYTQKDLPFDSASNVHVPITLEKLRAVHARFYQALFGVKPPFWVEPQEAIDEKRLTAIYNLMRWALTRFINYYKGIQGAVDEYLWNFASEGWGIMHLSWEQKVRKAIVVEEAEPTKADLKEAQTNPQFQLKFKEVMKWLETFSGPVLRNIQNEDAFIPGKGSIQDAPLIGFRTCWTKHELLYNSHSGYFSKEAVDAALPKYDTSYNTSIETSDVTNVKGVNQGYDLNADSNKPKDHDNRTVEYRGVIGYCTFDIDNDGFDEELVFWYHPTSKQVLRWTYLDRILKTGRRPVYKTDFIIRPGRNYALGLMELLHPLSIEVDAIHNQRIDFGTLSNMPFFFYRSLSNLPNQSIRIEPGKGIPVDDPQQDIFFPTLKSGTSWGFQEENLLFQIITRISGISDLNLGLPPSNSEAVRSQGQMLAVLSEGNAQLDIPLRRLQETFGEVYRDIHQLLVERLPRDFQHVIIGEDESVARDPKTNQILSQRFTDPRRDVAGNVHFNIQANSTAGSKALMKNNRMQLFQQLLNPINIQTGIVTPDEIYNMNKALLEVSDEVDIKRFIRKPETSPKPMTLTEEITSLQQGILPDIGLRDDHAAKAEAISTWVKDPSTIQGIQNGNISPQALVVAEQAIQLHMQNAELMNAMNQMFQNNTGSQNPMLSGAMQGMTGPAQGMPAQQGGPPSENE